MSIGLGLRGQRLLHLAAKSGLLYATREICTRTLHFDPLDDEDCSPLLFAALNCKAAVF